MNEQSRRSQTAATVTLVRPIRPPEILASIHVLGQAARRNIPQIIAPSGIRTAKHISITGGSGVGPAALWGWTVASRAIFLNRVPDERPSGRTRRRTNGRATHVPGRSRSDDRSRGRAITGARASGLVARVKRREKRKAKNSWN